MSVTTVRTDIVTRLKAGTLLSGVNVYDTRVTKFDPSELPLVSVVTEPVADESMSDGPLHFRRTVNVLYQVMVEQKVGAGTGAVADAALAAAVDSLVEAIRATLFTDVDFLTEYSIGDMTETHEVTVEGETRRGGAVLTMPLTYDVDYKVTGLDDFNRAWIDVDMIDPGDGPDGEVEVEIHVEGLNP